MSFRLKKNAGIGSLGSAFGESEVGSDSNRFGPSHRPPSIERWRPRHSRVMGWAWEFPHRTGGGGMGKRGSRRAETAGGLWGKQVWALVWGKSVVWFVRGRRFGVCVVLGLGISPCDRGRGNGEEGLATCGNGRGVAGKTGLGVGLGQIGRVVRLWEGFDGGRWFGAMFGGSPAGVPCLSYNLPLTFLYFLPPFPNCRTRPPRRMKLSSVPKSTSRSAVPSRTTWFVSAVRPRLKAAST